MSRLIYVVKDIGADLSTLEKMGNLYRVYPKEVSPFNMPQVLEHSRKALEFSHPEDFVVPIGPGVMVAVFIHEWLMKHGRVRFLLHHSADGTYKERRCDREAVTGDAGPKETTQRSDLKVVWNC